MITEPQLPQLVKENISRFTGRTWLLPKLLEWWNGSDSRIFLLIGGPGSGKSMISAWLAGFGPEPSDANAAMLLTKLRRVIKGAHFCQGRDITPSAFAASIANQLVVNKVAGFAEALATTLAGQVQLTVIQTIETITAGGVATGAHIDLGALGDELSFDRAFSDPLKRLYSGGHGEPMLLLVDALDEAQTYTGQRTLPHLLSRLDGFPAQVRILATTRDEPRVLKFFRSIKTFDLIKDADPDIDDIRAYATERLTRVVAVSDNTRTSFAERLSTHANGVFLYAAMVLDELLQRSIVEFPDLVTYPLPKGLSGLYLDFLNREFDHNEQLWSDLYRPLLGVIAVAQGEGLTAAQLARIIKRDEEEVGDALRRCKQYLSGHLPDGPFRHFHKSFVDFLLEDDENDDYHISPVSMHKRIADHYWSKYSDDWIKCDEYGRSHLAAHLFGADQLDRLSQLISQDWMQSRVACDGYRYDGFIADVMLAWRPAQARTLADIEAGKEPSTLAECFRYALIRTSITSHLSQYEPQLIKRAVETGLWSVERAMSVAKQVLFPEQRARLFEIVLEATPTQEERHRAASKALPEARSIQPPKARAIALSALVPQLVDSERDAALREAVNAAQEIEYVPCRLEALGDLAPRLTETERNIVLDAAVSVLAVSTTKEMRSAGAQKTFMPGSGGADEEWLRALTILVPQLSFPLVHRALSSVRHVDDGETRALAIAALLPKLRGEEHESVLSDGLAAARGIDDEWARATVLTALAPHVSGALLGQMRLLVRQTKDPFLVARLLTALAQANGPDKEERLSEALSAAQEISNEADRVRALLPIAPQRNGQLLATAYSTACQIQDAGSRVHTLATLAQRLTGQELEACLDVALATVNTTDQDWERASLLTEIAPYVDGPLVEKALLAAKQIDDADGRIRAISALVPKLPDLERAACLGEIVSMIKGGYRPELRVIRMFAPYLGKQMLADVLAVQGFEDETFYIDALAALAQHLQSPEKDTVLDYAVRAVSGIPDAWRRSEELVLLAPKLNRTQVSEALLMARAIKEDGLRVKVLVGLLGQLNGNEKEQVIAEAICSSAKIEQAQLRGEVLAALAPHLSGTAKDQVICEALQATRGIKGLQENTARSILLITLAPQLTVSLLAEALSIAKELRFGGERARVYAALARQISPQERITFLRDELVKIPTATRWTHERAATLAGLAAQLSGRLLDEALTMAHQINAPWEKARALTALARQMTGGAKEAVVQEALSAARQISSGELTDALRVNALIALAPELAASQKGSVLIEALEAVQACKGDEPIAEALAAISPHLNGVLLAQAFSLAQAIKDERCRTSAIAAIAKTARERGELLQELRKYIIDSLSSAISRGSRREIYESCCPFFQPPFVSTPVLQAVARHISDIALQWKWP